MILIRAAEINAVKNISTIPSGKSLCAILLRAATPLGFGSVAVASASAAAVLEFVNVGDPGNPSDPTTGLGGVSSLYAIGKYEVTNTQYADFLNATAASDPNALYNTGMDSYSEGGIIRLGSSGTFTYSVKPGYESMPVVLVSFFDAMRYSNWLNNGQGTGSTETGAYTLSLGGAAPRNAGAKFWIPSENEWYKAAYYQPAAKGGDTDSYWLYPTRSNAIPNSRNGSMSDANSGNFSRDDGIANGFNGGYAVTNSPNLDSTQNYLTNVDAFTSAASYYGTFDQSGNVAEWNDTDFGIFIGPARGVRDGDWLGSEVSLRSSGGGKGDARNEGINRGFRVATVPEPRVAVSALLGLVLLACRRKRSV